MRGSGARLQIALFAGAGLAILAGASFNIQGYKGETALLAMLAGILAWSAGVLYSQYRIAIALFVAALVITLVETRFSRQFLLGINTAGLLCLTLGGVLGSIAYGKVTHELRRRLTKLERLNAELEEQHRMFLAATEDPGLAETDPGKLAANTAHQLDAGICCYYLMKPDTRQFMPLLPGAGFEGRRPQSLVPRREGGDPIVTVLEGNQEFLADDRDRLSIVSRLFPTGFRLENVLIQPMLMNGRLGGFILLGNKEGGFTTDDRRLASTLAVRAAIHFGSQQAVTQTSDEIARYSILADIANQASGLSPEAVMELVVARARDLVPYDACRVVTFEPNGTFIIIGGGGSAAPIERSALAEVKTDARVVIRRLMTRADGLFSGVDPGSDSAQAAEALTPISGREGVFGALCLGRKGGMSFTERDIPALQELGAIAGVAVENSRMLQKAAGQATNVNSALDSLNEISSVLTATTHGTAALEQKTLEVAARLVGGTHALLTRGVAEGRHLVVRSLGFKVDPRGMEIANGQGIVGAVMVSGQPLHTPDVIDSFDLASPPELALEGVHGAVCVPIIHQERLWGTLAVLGPEKKDWSDDEARVLAILGNQAVAALQNAELFDRSRQKESEHSNLHEGLTAITSTLDLENLLNIVLASASKAAAAQIGVLALLQDGGKLDGGKLDGGKLDGGKLDGGKLEVRAAFGADPETARRLALDLAGEICLDVLASGTAFMDYSDRPSGAGDDPLDPRAVLCVPLKLRTKVIGVLFLSNHGQGRPFTEDHKRLLVELGAQASGAIENARLFRDRETVMLEAITALAATVDARDGYTAGHSQRVTEYSLTIAKEMNYKPGDETAWRKLRQGALLHDIGKINVPDAILSKPDRLTDAEFAILRSHTIVGYDLLRHLNMLTDELVIVRSHHERYDGKGYPDGKGAGALDILAFIVGAADAFDAMTCDRPYRRALSLEVALTEINKGAGTHFHPDVAAAMLQSAARGGLKIIPHKALFAEAPVRGAFEKPAV